MKNNIHLNMPYLYNIIIFKKKKTNFLDVYFIFNNETFSFNINLTNNLFYINRDTNSILLAHNCLNINIIHDINLFLKKTLNFNLMFFLKIKFKGKGYKIKYYRNNKLMFFYFGRSHISLMKFTNIGVIKLGKYKFILAGYCYDTLKNLNKIILNIRRLNQYTLRGLRNSKQIITKRKGKKSSSV